MTAQQERDLHTGQPHHETGSEHASHENHEVEEVLHTVTYDPEMLPVAKSDAVSDAEEVGQCVEELHQGPPQTQYQQRSTRQ